MVRFYSYKKKIREKDAEIREFTKYPYKEMMKLTNANTKTQIICNTTFLGKFSRNFPNGQEIMDRLILWHAMLSLFKVATITQTSSNY